MTKKYEDKFNIMIIGDEKVGKTTILERYMNKTFHFERKQTIGIENYDKVILFKNKEYLIKIWDTAGQERFKSLIPSYIKDSAVAIVCYDVTNKESFQSVEKWIEDAKAIREDDVLLILVGNKADMD